MSLTKSLHIIGSTLFDNLPRVDAVQKKIGGNMQYVLQLAVTFLGVD